MLYIIYLLLLDLTKVYGSPRTFMNKLIFGLNPYIIVPLRCKERRMKGTANVPFCYFQKKLMSEGMITEQVEAFVDEVLAAAPSYFKVKFKVKPTNNYKVYIDGDQGITIDQCIKFNRALYKKIEDAGLHPDGNFSLEVSSPGVDEPLQNIRQYRKNIGRKVEVTLSEERKLEGVLKEVREKDILIEETKGKGKKAVTEVIALPLQEIIKTIVQIQF